MSVTLRYDAKFHIDDIPALLLDLVPTNPTLQPRITYPGISGTFDGSATVAVDENYTDTLSLSAGAYTLDLRALVSTAGVSKDFNGKKVKGIIIASNAANTSSIVVRDGATNPYTIWGATNRLVSVWPGFPIMQIFGNNLLAVSATVKTIDFSSSDLDAEFQIALVVGA